VAQHAGAAAEFGDSETEEDADAIYGLAEGQGLADGDPLRIFRLLRGGSPASVIAAHHTCLS
jgi:hypothetical protein